METFESAQRKILDEIMGDSLEVKADFQDLLSYELDEFTAYIGHAVVDWLVLDGDLRESDRRSLASGLMHSMIALLTVSTKLLFEGHLTASGNILRQAMEAIALSMLISNNKISVYERFMEHKYSTTKSLQDVLNNADILGVSRSQLEQLKEQSKQYDGYSHMSFGTIGSFVSFEDTVSLYLGGSFDKGKIEAYKTEMNIRLNVSGGLRSVIHCIKANLEKSGE